MSTTANTMISRQARQYLGVLVAWCVLWVLLPALEDVPMVQAPLRDYAITLVCIAATAHLAMTIFSCRANPSRAEIGPPVLALIAAGSTLSLF